MYFISKRKLCFAVATRITFICPMTFNSFPLDVQVCLFQVSAVVMQVVMIVFITYYSRLDLSTTTTPRWSSMTPLQLRRAPSGTVLYGVVRYGVLWGLVCLVNWHVREHQNTHRMFELSTPLPSRHWTSHSKQNIKLLKAKMEGKPVWKLLADMTPEKIVSLIDFRYQLKKKIFNYHLDVYIEYLIIANINKRRYKLPYNVYYIKIIGILWIV